MNIFISLLLLLPIFLEPFPISSSGHALLLEQLYALLNITVPALPAIMDHWLHGPVAIAVVCYFFRSWLLLLYQQKNFLLCSVALGVTEIITVSWYIFFSYIGKTFFPLQLGFLITALLLLSLLFCSGKNEKNMLTIFDGVLFGMMQGIALLPGISRLGSTFVIARWRGFSPQQSFALSFLIEFPISVAAFLKGSYVLMSNNNFMYELLNLMPSFVILIAIIGCYEGLWLMHYIVKKDALWMFGIYMLFITVIASTLSLF